MEGDRETRKWKLNLSSKKHEEMHVLWHTCGRFCEDDSELWEPIRQFGSGTHH
jgi:hypothetical protein